MTFLEKYHRHYGDLAMADHELYRNHCPGEFAGITGENVPMRPNCPDCDCEDCWLQQRTKPVLTVYVDGEDVKVKLHGAMETVIYAVMAAVRSAVASPEIDADSLETLRHALRPESGIWKKEETHEKAD